MNRDYLLLIAALVGAVALYLFWPTDEARIKKLITEGARAVESEDIDAVTAKVSYNYRDDYGLTYLSLRETLKREFTSLSDIRVEHEKLSIEVKEGKAIAEVDVRVIATVGPTTGFIVGDGRSPVRLRFFLEKERAKWLVVKTEGFGK